VINLIKTFPNQLSEALELTHQLDDLNTSFEDVNHIVISGMGGSGIGVHLVKSIVEDYCHVPITLIQGYRLPKWVNDSTLFIACSYSGNTEETLTLLELAKKVTKNIFTITTGGKLKAISDQNAYPQYNFSGEAECPRAGLAFPSVAMLSLISKLGFCPGLNIKDEIQKTSEFLQNEQEAIIDLAKKYSKTISNHFTFLYGDQIFYPALLRFQQQLAENSKQVSHLNVFPELNHNELVGWENPKHHISNSKVIILRSDLDHERNKLRMNISKSILAEKTEVIELMALGETFTQQVYYFIHLADWISFCLAEENHVDPFPVEKINYLKNKLAH